jgi:hypothetical protein
MNLHLQPPPQGGKTTTNVAMNFINMLVVDGLLSALAGKNDLLTI